MSQVTPILLVLILLTLFGCATSEPFRVNYDSATGMSTFESNRIIMGYRNMSGGLASNQRVMWQAMGSCSGQNCIPGELELVFYNDTSKDLNLDSRRLQLIVDGTTHDWEDLTRTIEGGFYGVPPGEFIRVPLTGHDFVKLAQADKVEVLFGETGTSVFNVSFMRRAEFRAFAEVLGL